MYISFKQNHEFRTPIGSSSVYEFFVPLRSRASARLASPGRPPSVMPSWRVRTHVQLASWSLAGARSNSLAWCQSELRSGRQSMPIPLRTGRNTYRKTQTHPSSWANLPVPWIVVELKGFMLRNPPRSRSGPIRTRPGRFQEGSAMGQFHGASGVNIGFRVFGLGFRNSRRGALQRLE